MGPRPKITFDALREKAILEFGHFPLSEGLLEIEGYLERQRLNRQSRLYYKRAYWPVIEYFGSRKTFDYSDDMIEKCTKHLIKQRTIAESRSEKDKLKFSCRIVGMLKDYYSGNEFKQRYDKSDLIGENNVSELRPFCEGYIELENHLRNNNVDPGTIHSYFLAYKRFCNYCDSKHINAYSSELTDGFRTYLLSLLRAGKIHTSNYDFAVRVSKYIDEYYKNGKIIRKDPHNEKIQLSCEDEELLVEFKNYLGSKNIKENTIVIRITCVRAMLKFLSDIGISDYSQLNSKIICDCIVAVTKKRQNSMNAFLTSIRQFIEFLRFKGEKIPEMLNVYPFKPAPPHKKIHPAFTEDELSRLLGAPDRNTLIGKRDYAIMLLASYTSIRSCDIAELRIDSYDKEKREISFVQSKTGKMNRLPITNEHIEAIDDYLSARSDTLPYLFCTSTKPYKKLNPRRMIVANKYYEKAGIPSNKGIGFHTFRRTVGAWLLDGESRAEEISQILGHTGINSIKHYLPMSLKLLKQCPLDAGIVPLLAKEYL